MGVLRAIQARFQFIYIYIMGSYKEVHRPTHVPKGKGGKKAKGYVEEVEEDM